MNRQLKIAELKRLSDRVGPPAFDQAILVEQTMSDPALAAEILELFIGQLKRLEALEWGDLEMAFEMHTLKGAAAVVGALEIEVLAEDWKAQGKRLEFKLKGAFTRFREAATAA